MQSAAFESQQEGEAHAPHGCHVAVESFGHTFPFDYFPGRHYHHGGHDRRRPDVTSLFTATGVSNPRNNIATR